MTTRIARRAYADMFGPTTGDRVRLADTELFIEVERDLTIYGEEVKFGGGKVIRDGMGQSQRSRAAGAVDTVITNALILDHWGIVKADIGIKDGRIAAIGKAGNPDIQPGVDIVIGPGTEIIAGEGKIVTAGGIDAHIHFICPQQIEEALYSGITTMLGGGTGPATGTAATTCTPGPWHIARMLQAAEAFPMNLGFFGKGNASRPEALVEQIEAGACGLKLHEDWGTTPAAIDCCLTVADATTCRSRFTPTPSMNPVSSRTRSPPSRAARSMPTTPKARAAAMRRTSSGSAARPMSCRRRPIRHGPTPSTRSTSISTCSWSAITSTRPFPRTWPSPKPHPARDHRRRGYPARPRRVLHDVLRQPGDGARRRSHHPHLADGAQDEAQRGRLPEETGDNDNLRAKRYIAKYTINPAIAHGIAHEVGSIEVGKLADLVLWKPAFFGVKPEMVLKGGIIAAAAMGDPNASIPTPQPVHYRPMFAGFGRCMTASAVTFVSAAAASRELAGSPRPRPPAGGGRQYPRRDLQGQHDPQRRHAEDGRRSRDL